MSLLDAFPALRFSVELPHYVVALEINFPVRHDINAMINHILNLLWQSTAAWWGRSKYSWTRLHLRARPRTLRHFGSRRS
jgi:hypothetical protein